MHSMFSAGTEEYQRFMKLVKSGFARMEDWGAASSNGKEAMDAWLKAAEKRMSDFKLNPNWSQMLVPPTMADLTDAWATQSGVIPEFPVIMKVVGTKVDDPWAGSKLPKTNIQDPADLSSDEWFKIDNEALEKQRAIELKRFEALYVSELKSNEETIMALTDNWAVFYTEQTKMASEASAAKAQAMKQMEEEQLAKMTTVNEMLSTSMTDNLLDMADGTKTVGQAFKDMATGILRDLAAMIVKQAIFNALQAASRAAFGFSEGGVFSPGSGHSNEAFAAGGVIRKPTHFAYGGGIGLMGEKGAEAIMPLTNTSKGLGVMAQMPVNDNGKNGGVTLVLENLNINAVDSQSFFELTARNPEAILQPIKEALIIGDIGLRSLLKE